MRSLLAFLALVLGLVAATVSLLAYVAHETVLDPDRAGDVLSSAVQVDGVREQILSETVPGYSQLPDAYRQEIDRLAGSRQVDRALDEVRVDAQGRADLSPVRRQLAQQLRDGGFGQVASQVESTGEGATLRVPDRVWEPYTTARDNSWLVATRGAIVAGAAFLLALLVARSRRGALQGVGVVLILSAAATYAVLSVLPAAADAYGADRWMRTAAATIDPSSSTVLSILVPVGIAGLLVALVGFVIPRPRRY